MPAVVPEAWEHAIIADVVHVQHVLRAKPRISLAYRILSGPVAGVQVLENANASFGSVLFRLCAGYPRGVRYETPLQLIGLRLGVSLGNAGGRLAVKGHDISSGLVPVNAKLTRSRLRVLAVCPFGGTVDCVLCPVGRNECKRSMNPESTQLIV